MIVRLGYVAMAIDLKNCSPSKTITFSRFETIEDKEVQLYKLKKLTEENLNNTRRILLYNKAHDIQVYRITSKLVPLVTHQGVLEWDYTKEFNDMYKSISSIIKENNMRISAHPDHFTIISSPRDDVLKTALQDLVYHNNIMDSISLDEEIGKLVLHVGGKYDSKEKTKYRFIDNFASLPKKIRKRIILENDDKIYDIHDVLDICEELKIPMVLDIHHHWCNNRDDDIKDYIDRIFNTWNYETLIPVIHISSPRSEKNIRAHADDVDFEFFNEFIRKARKFDRDFDIMIEAKNKNLALFNLMAKIKNHPDYKVIDNASFEI